jgi:hypothetical protein
VRDRAVCGGQEETPRPVRRLRMCKNASGRRAANLADELGQKCEKIDVTPKLQKRWLQH